MKRLLMTIALTCVLSVSALAGEMPACGVTSPAPGDIPMPVAEGDQGNGGLADDGNQGTGGLALLIFDLFF